MSHIRGLDELWCKRWGCSSSSSSYGDDERRGVSLILGASWSSPRPFSGAFLWEQGGWWPWWDSCSSSSSSSTPAHGLMMILIKKRRRRMTTMTTLTTILMGHSWYSSFYTPLCLKEEEEEDRLMLCDKVGIPSPVDWSWFNVLLFSLHRILTMMARARILRVIMIIMEWSSWRESVLFIFLSWWRGICDGSIHSKKEDERSYPPTHPCCSVISYLSWRSRLHHHPHQKKKEKPKCKPFLRRTPDTMTSVIIPFTLKISKNSQEHIIIIIIIIITRDIIIIIRWRRFGLYLLNKEKQGGDGGLFLFCCSFSPFMYIPTTRVTGRMDSLTRAAAFSSSSSWW